MSALREAARAVIEEGRSGYFTATYGISAAEKRAQRMVVSEMFAEGAGLAACLPADLRCMLLLFAAEIAESE
jgi:hypothetical protein